MSQRAQTVEPDDDSSGAHFSEQLTVTDETPDDDAEEQFEAYAAYLCAGYAAVLAAEYPEEQAAEGCDSDFGQAGHRLDVGKRMAVELMQRPENRRAVFHVAEALLRLKCLDQDHLAVIISVADGEMTETEYQEYLNFRKQVHGG